MDRELPQHRRRGGGAHALLDAGFAPTIAHRVDSLELVQDLIRTGLGVGLLPLDQPTHPDVAVLPLHSPTLTLRAYTATRRGRAQWAPLAVVLESLQR